MGVPDLGALKASTQDKENAAKALLQQLQQHALICQCGAHITTGGVELFGAWSGMVPVGPGQAAPAGVMATLAFCSTLCAEYVKAARDGWEFDLGFGPRPVRALGVRELAPRTWFADVV